MNNAQLTMNNMRKMYVFLLILFTTFFVSGCNDPLELNETDLPPVVVEDATEDAYGRIRIDLTEGETAPEVVPNLVPNLVRTVLPPVPVFDTYVYTFIRTGAMAGVELTPDDDGVFTVDVGDYTVSVQAFIGTAEAFTLAATGVSAPFTINTGDNGSIVVPLSEADNGKGQFKFTITWPAGAGGEITLQTWPDMNPVTVNPANVSGGNGKTQTLQLNTGSYLLTVLISKNNLYAGLNEAVHIYPGTFTEYTRNFGDTDLLIPYYAVTFDTNGDTSGTFITTMGVPAGSPSSITLPGGGGLFKPGYAFGGWNTNAAGTGTNYPAGASYTVTGSTTLYAKWDVVYTVTYDINGGNETPSAQTVYPGTVITLHDGNGLTGDGRIFSNWNTNASGTGIDYAPGDSYTVNETITLYVKWDAAITYSINGGTGTTPSTQKITGSAITLPGNSEFARTGYTFGGWNTNAAGTGTTYAAGSSYTSAAGIALYARWTSTVTFNTNGATAGAAPSALTVPAGSAILVPTGTGIYRSNYTFDGWNTSSYGTGTTYAANSFYTPTGNITLYARWTTTVTFNLNGGSGTVYPAKIVPAGTGITLPLSGGIFREGCVFVGWEGGGNIYDQGAFFTPTANITFYARWAHLIIYDINGGTGTVPDSRRVSISGNVELPDGTGFSRNGYTFNGWNTKADGTGTHYNAGSLYFPNDIVTLYADWYYNGTSYTVTFNMNGATGTVPATQTTPAGFSITLPGDTDFSRPGYIFGGWNTNAAGTGTNYAAGSAYKPSSNITLYAKWNINELIHTVAFYTNGATSGSAPASQMVGTGSSIKLPDGTGFSRTGYVFGGWNTNSAGTGDNYSAGSDYKPTASITLYARWITAGNVTVNYNVNGGSGTTPSSLTGPAGSVITLSSAAGLARTGYTLSGWNTLANGNGTTYAIGSSYTLTGTITLYARWTSTVTYSVNNGTGVVAAANTVPAGDTITLPGGSGLSRNGYTFAGWNTQSNGTGTTYPAGSSYTPTGNITLYVRWLSVGTIKPLNVNQWSDGSLASPSDGQWFSFNATANTQYIHLGYIAPAARYTVQVYDSNYNEVGSSASFSNGLVGNPSSTGYFSRNVTVGQTYYVQVTTSNYGVTYKILFNTTWYPPLRATLIQNTRIPGEIPVAFGDQWFSFIATSSENAIYFGYGYETDLDDMYVQLYDSNGSTVGAREWVRKPSDPAATARFSPATLTAGQTYYIQVTTYGYTYGGFNVFFN